MVLLSSLFDRSNNCTCELEHENQAQESPRTNVCGERGNHSDGKQPVREVSQLIVTSVCDSYEPEASADHTHFGLFAFPFRFIGVQEEISMGLELQVKT